MKQEISNALQAVSFAHHQEFVELEHSDPDWARWYAQWLLEESEVSELLNPHFGVNQLANSLRILDGTYRHLKGHENWHEYFARDLSVHIKDQM